MSLRDIALSGLRVAQYAKQLTGSNISNANNPFFTRRGLDFLESSSSQFGTGVKVGDVRRVIDTTANQQLMNSTFDLSKSKVLADKLSQLEIYIDNADSSVSKFINESLASLESLNATPGSAQARQHFLNQLQNMSHRFQDVDRRLRTEIDDSRESIRNNVKQANNLLQRLSNINEQVATQHGQSESSQYALFDQRDKLLSELGQLIDFQHQIDDKGQLGIQLSNGMSLLVDNKPVNLVAIEQGQQSDIKLGIENKNGITDINNLFSSGSIKGMMEYMNTLQKAKTQTDRVGLTIAFEMNAQNRLGVDANGVLGGFIFNDVNSSSVAANRVIADNDNTLTAVMSVGIQNPQLLEDSEYELRFTSATDYQLVRLSDGNMVQSGTVAGFPHQIQTDGFSINIDSGNFAAGENYHIAPVKDAVMNMNLAIQNGQKLALASPVITEASTNNQGTGKIELDKVIDIENAVFSIPKQLNPPIKIEFISAISYRIVNANDDSIIEDNINYDPASGADTFPTPGGFDPGFRIKLDGEMVAGDSFNINYNADGLGDNRNGLQMSQLYHKTGELAGFTDLYQEFEFYMSSSVSSAKSNFESANILYEQAQTRRDEASGVSLMEEMMNMSNYQEFYMANAQVLQTVNQTMDTLFSLLRR